MDHKNNNDENQYYSWRLRGPGWNIGRAATVMDIKKVEVKVIISMTVFKFARYLFT